eukprot:2690222-Amphidinium_carterae.1
MDSPIHVRTPQSTARRSLAAIQYDVVGGTLHQARRCAGSRFRMHRKKCLLVAYNPQTPGDCLFAVIARAIKTTYGQSVTVHSLRSTTRDLLRDADQVRVDTCARFCGQKLEDHINSVVKGRWGTSLDFELLAREYDLPFNLMNLHNGQVLYEGRTQAGSGVKKITVGYKDHHFILCKKKFGVNQRPARPRAAARHGMQYGKTNMVVGGAPKRPYPFGEVARRQREEAIADGGLKPITLIYHGSFAPMHTGHREAIMRAHQFLKAHGYVAQRTILGFTTTKHVGEKTEDKAFAQIQQREAIARAVVAEGDPFTLPVILDGN